MKIRKEMVIDGRMKAVTADEAANTLDTLGKLIAAGFAGAFVIWYLLMTGAIDLDKADEMLKELLADMDAGTPQ